MPNVQTVTVYNYTNQRRSLRHLLSVCVFIFFVGLLAIIMSSFTGADFHGVPIIKVIGGVFLIVGLILSIISGSALIRLPSCNTQTFSTTAEERMTRRTSVLLTDIYLNTLPYATSSPLAPSPPPPFDAPPSYEEAVRQQQPRAESSDQDTWQAL